MLTTLKSTGTPTRLIIRDDPLTLVVNRDITNQVLYGPLSIVSQNQAEYSILDPLGAINLDGSNGDIYFIGASGSPTVDVIPGGSNWVASPAQVAAQISALGLATSTNQATQIANETTIASNTNTTATNVSAVNSTLGTPAQNPAVQQLGGAAGRSIATDMLNANKGVTTELAALVATGSAAGAPGGMPLLRKTNNLGNSGGGTTIAALNTLTLANALQINQPSYEAAISLSYNTTNGTTPFAILLVTWNDNATGLQMYQEQYAIQCGPVGTGINVYLTGPVHANQVTIQIQNLDSVQTMLCKYIVNATSHVYTRPTLFQPTIVNTIPGFSVPSGNPDVGVLFSSQPSLGSSGTVTRLLPAYNGLIHVTIDCSGLSSGVAVSWADPMGGTLYNSAALTFWSNSVAAGGRATFPNVAMPGGTVLMTIHNTGTTAITPVVVGVLNNQS